MFGILVVTVFLAIAGQRVYEAIPQELKSWRYYIALTIGAVIMFIDLTYIILQRK